MSATLTSPSSPTESPCLVNCDVVTTTSTTAPAEVTTGSGNGWPDGANRLGAVTYYSAIALAIVLLICVAIFSRFLYTRRLRKAYAQRAAQNSVLHARELEDQRRRGEADGLPGYYEPSGPAPPLPVQPTIDQLSGGRNEVSWLPAWMRGVGGGTGRWWRREKPENPTIPLQHQGQGTTTDHGLQDGVMVDHRTGVVSVVMEPPRYTKDLPLYEEVASTPQNVPTYVIGTPEEEEDRRASTSMAGGTNGAVEGSADAGAGAGTEEEDRERERERRELEDYERRTRGL